MDVFVYFSRSFLESSCNRQQHSRTRKRGFDPNLTIVFVVAPNTKHPPFSMSSHDSHLPSIPLEAAADAEGDGFVNMRGYLTGLIELRPTTLLQGQDDIDSSRVQNQRILLPTIDPEVGWERH
jgi:hypothetical protein